MPRQKTDRAELARRQAIFREWRRRLGISQKEAAKLLHYSASTVKDLEAGRTFVSDYILNLISDEHL